MNIARMPYQWPGLASYNITQSYSISLCKQSTSHWEFSSLGVQFQCKVWRSLPLVLEFLLRLGRWTGTLFVFSSFTSIVARIFRAVCKIKPHASPITLHFTTSCKCEGIFTVGTLCNHTQSFVQYVYAHSILFKCSNSRNTAAEISCYTASVPTSCWQRTGGHPLRLWLKPKYAHNNWTIASYQSY